MTTSVDRHHVRGHDSEICLRAAKALLGELIDRAEQEQPLTLTGHGKPAAHIVPIAEPRRGLLKGRIGMADYFDEKPDRLVEAFEGSSADNNLLPH